MELECQSELQMNDWRLQGQEKYLKGIALERKKYHPYRDGWDHDHCEFCGAEFSLEGAGAFGFGYASPDNYHWICDNCFEDFKEKFDWKVISSG